MASQQRPLSSPPPKPGGRQSAGAAAIASRTAILPAGDFGPLGAARAGGTPPPTTHPSPRTPEMSPAGRHGGRPSGPRSSNHSAGSASPSDDASSLASGTTASFSSAADVALFAPASTEDAVHAVPSLLSQLLSGRTDEQVLAARKLLAYCRACGRPVEQAVAAAGGVHMLLIMLDSLDRGLRDVCTRILTDLAEDDAIRAEILASPGGTAKVIQLMFRGILDGQASAGRFLELLAGSRSEALQAALCRSKVVRMLCRALESGTSGKARGAALSALQAFCQQDAANLRKLVWSGGVEALVKVLQPADGAASQHSAALQLLHAAVAAQPDAANSLATAPAVEALAAFVGAPGQPLEAQAAAADVLAAVAAAPVRRQGCQQALTDHALPRAFEIVHEAAAAGAGADCGAAAGARSASNGGDSSQGASPAVAEPSNGQCAAAGGGGKAHGGATQRLQQQGQQQEDGEGEARAAARLRAAAAALVAHLAARDPECCHSLLLHARLLRPAVQMLVGGGRYAAAQKLLAAAKGHALGLAPGAPPSPLTGRPGSGGSRLATATA